MKRTQLRTPIFVLEGHDVGIFATREDAENHLEPNDVQEGIYDAYDASGLSLRISTDGKRTFIQPGDDGRTETFDPATGRFLQIDPLAQPMTKPHVGEYAYVGNRPTVMVAPSGHFGWFGAFVGGVVGGLVNSAICVGRIALTDEEFSWRGLGSSAASGAIAGAVAGVTGGMAWGARAAVNFAGGAVGSITGDAICGGFSPGSALSGGAANAIGAGVADRFLPPPAVSPTGSFVFGAVRNNVLGSGVGGAPTAVSACGMGGFAHPSGRAALK